MSTLSVLGVAFVILKLCEVIHWSWWWVLLPFYGPLLVAGALFAIAGLITFFLAMTGKPKIRHYGVTPRKQKKLLRRGGR